MDRVIHEQFISLPTTIYNGTLLTSLGVWDVAPLYLTGAITVSIAVNHMLKSYVKQARPSGCGIRVGRKCFGCGIRFEGKPSTSFGWPSGHAQTMATIAMFSTLWILGRSDDEPKSRIGNLIVAQRSVSISIIWALAVAVCAQRVVSKCHSINQVVFGTLIGSLMGYASWRFAHAVDPSRFP